MTLFFLAAIILWGVFIVIIHSVERNASSTKQAKVNDEKIMTNVGGDWGTIPPQVERSDLSNHRAIQNGKTKGSFFALSTILLYGGLVVGIYFLAFFDTSIQVPEQEILGQIIGGQRVNNLGLMNDRQNGIYLGFGAFAVGLILRYLEENRKGSNKST